MSSLERPMFLIRHRATAVVAALVIAALGAWSLGDAPTLDPAADAPPPPAAIVASATH